MIIYIGSQNEEGNEVINCTAQFNELLWLSINYTWTEMFNTTSSLAAKQFKARKVSKAVAKRQMIALSVTFFRKLPGPHWPSESDFLWRLESLLVPIYSLSVRIKSSTLWREKRVGLSLNTRLISSNSQGVCVVPKPKHYTARDFLCTRELARLRDDVLSETLSPPQRGQTPRKQNWRAWESEWVRWSAALVLVAWQRAAFVFQCAAEPSLRFLCCDYEHRSRCLSLIRADPSNA